jgi:hypothetical protein
MACLWLLSRTAADPLPRPECQVAYFSRRDAYDGTFDLSQCEERGFCWQAAPRGSNIPWCYHSIELEGFPTVAECAAGAAGERRDCAPGGGVDAFSCSNDRRCCWAPGGEGQPWCFYAAGQGHADAEDVPEEDYEM